MGKNKEKIENMKKLKIWNGEKKLGKIYIQNDQNAKIDEP